MADTENDARFGWTAFYESVAEKLLDYQTKPKRKELVDGIHEIVSPRSKYLRRDKFADGREGPLEDICPFTAMGIFNRWKAWEPRIAIAEEFGKFLGVSINAPKSFEGIPKLDDRKSWFFAKTAERKNDDIDRLWRVFALSAELAVSGTQEKRAHFVQAYNSAINVKQVAWNLTFGLYWAHPWDFVSLDYYSQVYIATHLGCLVPNSETSTPCNGDEYLKLNDYLKEKFSQPDTPVKSFPELSYAAWNEDDSEEEPDESFGNFEQEKNETSAESYSVNNIREDGCFLPLDEITRFLERLRTKKNLILQGPPGTGKTWLAKRLAYALMGEKNPHNVRAVQFHPNLSYEDFVRGWRPSGDGKLKLTDGAFMQMVETALGDPDSKFVVVIEEINRGNPAQIFGELLTLLEADKRNPDDALELSYSGPDGKNGPVYIPENLYVIGTMNLADRSLALVDFALRRRFAFVTLKPQFTDAWQRWIVEHRGIDGAFANTMKVRMESLNQEISGDAKLGPQFCIGHSYLTPAESVGVDETRAWFRQVVETEISPLLEEYWFDDPDKAQQERDKLLEGS